MATRKDKSIARAGFSDDVGAKRSHKTFSILPSQIRADHRNNYARAAMYSRAVEMPELADHPAFDSDECCFSRAEVLERADSLLKNSQRQAIKVWRTNTHLPYVSEGFLRHIAALYLEVTGALTPDLRNGLRCEAEEQPKSPEQLVEAAWSNYAENADRKDMTPIDQAWFCKRLVQMQVDRVSIATRLSKQRGKEASKRTVDRLLSLLSLPINTQLAIHEGKTTVSAALEKAKQTGQGTSRGANPGIQRAAMRRRSPEKRPAKSLSPEQIDEMIDIINGDKSRAEASAAVQDYVNYLDAPKAPKKPRKKAPPKAEKKS